VQETTVVLGVEDPALQEEILHFLERLPHVRVVGTAHRSGDLNRHIREARPHAAVVSSALLVDRADLDGAALFVVGMRETTGELRLAIRAGARGFYLWPEEREALGRDAGRARRPTDAARPDPGCVVAVYGPRGGVGTTFVATNLAAACARSDLDTLLVDLDLRFADVTAAVGLGEKASELRGFADLAPVLAELQGSHLEHVVQGHPAGFKVLLAPNDARSVPALTAKEARGLARVAASGFEAVILHLPRTLDDATAGALEAADVVLLVVTLDVFALRDARRALDAFADHGLERKCRVVVNRASRGEIVPQDAERVLAIRPTVIRFDRAVPRAQNRGELVVGRAGRAGRSILALARDVLGEDES
jgi:pilus assembly protein CpaE